MFVKFPEHSSPRERLPHILGLSLPPRFRPSVRFINTGTHAMTRTARTSRGASFFLPPLSLALTCALVLSILGRALTRGSCIHTACERTGHTHRGEREGESEGASGGRGGESSQLPGNPITGQFCAREARASRRLTSLL